MRKVIVTLLFLGVIAVVVISAPRPYAKMLHARLGGEMFSLEVVDTDALRERGLSGRTGLTREMGMLFVFDHADRYGFWMKDMRFPIDIIWFDDAYRIVDAKQNASPASYPEVFTPKAPARYVLELPAGFFAEHSLETGSVLEIIK